MAHYLPTLLVSVNAALTSDDSHLETQPRGQVDYLSHEWEEEDVWKSWRNMTRQKNEIANGMRLENASWRTWWKQRNNLKTVSPETLNWLKDSDVTWLYGPLHTAVDWTPPPKPKPDPSSVDDRDPATAHDRLDLVSSTDGRHKSILKHRSISELLTSDLPATIVGRRDDEQELAQIPEEPAAEEDSGDASESASQSPKRPSIPHTKSDTHLTRWASNASKQADQQLDSLGLRKASPPRILAAANHGSESSTPSSGSVSPSPDPNRKKKQRHITFNTFVEQCIAIEKPSSPLSNQSRSSSNSSFRIESRNTSQAILHAPQSKSSGWDGRTSGVRWAGAEDEDDEDEDINPRSSSPCSSSSDETPFESSSPYVQARPWVTPPYAQARRNGTGSSPPSDDEYEDVWEDTTTSGSESTSADREGDDEDDDGIIEMRPSRHTPQRRNSSTGEQKPNMQQQKPRPQRRRSSGENTVTPSGPSATRRSPSFPDFKEDPQARKPQMRQRGSGKIPRSSSGLPSVLPLPQNQNHITIAPIPPTTLKVGWDGFGVTPGTYTAPYSDWMDGFGDEYTSDGEYAGKWCGKQEHSDASGDLVYVPRYSTSTPTSGEEEESDENRVWHHEHSYFSTEDVNGQTAPSKPRKIPSRNNSSQSVPIVVRTPPAVGAPNTGDSDKDAYDYFGGPDLGEDFGEMPGRRRGSYTPRKSRPLNGGSNNTRSSRSPPMMNGDVEEEQERGRSRSRSRTPSPAVAGVSSPPGVRSPILASSPPGHSLSPPGGSSSPLLSPPSRGRSIILQASSRGESSTSSSSFGSSRERDRSSHTSPLGSLSPDGTGGGYNKYGFIGAAYANGRSEQKERELREDEEPRRGVRGRRERRLSPAGSPGKAVDVREPSDAVDIQRQEEEAERSRHPTPANSPITHTATKGATSKPASCSGQSQPSSPTSGHAEGLTNEEDGTIIGRVVNSAGAYLGFWNNGGAV